MLLVMLLVIAVNIYACMVFVHPCACSVSLGMHVCREVTT